MIFTRRLPASLWIAAAALLTATSVTWAETNWPRWRGPDGTGHSADANLPVTWGAESVLWKTKLGGTGQSCPIIWGERIFLTAAEKTSSGVQRSVICINRQSGKVLWQQTASTSDAESLHKMNTWATSSCCTDGERVVAFFGQGGIHCFNVEGKKLWSHDLGSFAGAWGTAASPVLVDDMVVQNCDAEGKSYLIAYDKATGKQLWRTERRATPKGGWSTPILIDAGGRRELVLNGEFGVQAYDPVTGKDLWSCKGFNGRGTPTPAVGNGLVYVVNGKPGDLYAVRPGGSGDVTGTHMAWHTPRKGGRDLPSPILVGDYLFTVSMSGIATCYQPTTGKLLWTDRLGGNYAGSPFAAGGLIYLQNEAGETLVIKPGNKLDILARNKLGNAGSEIFRASLTPSAGQIFARSGTTLYCIGKTAAGE